MEEYVGQIWHKYITKAASLEFAEAKVELNDIRHTLAIQFRAFGGDLALELKDALNKDWEGKRSFLSKLASSQQKMELASVGINNLYLPKHIAIFPDKELNKKTYLWLSALLASYENSTGTNWLEDNVKSVNKTLSLFPGLRRTYRVLSQEHVKLRSKIKTLKQTEDELIIQRLLLSPDISEVSDLNLDSFNPKDIFPVPLWCDPFPAEATRIEKKLKDTQTESDIAKHEKAKKVDLRKKGEHVDDIDEKDGLMAFRLDSVFSWTEYIPVDRTADEENEDQAALAAEDIDQISVVRGSETTAGKLKFDLDLPGSDQDDITINEGIKLPEWDYRKSALQKDFCRLHTMQPRKVEKHEFSPKLREKAKRLKAQFEFLVMQKQWLKGQPDGSEIDLERFILRQADELNGQVKQDSNLYLELRQNSRSLSCLLLADLSLSTDSYVNNESKIIDMIKDSLYLFSESLSATQDRFAIGGFSSKRRDMVRYYPIKSFDEKQSKTTLDKISSLTPGYYTRMGAAIRHAANQLEKESTETKLLLLLSDGKPNDIDLYEGRYGIEDTKHAVREAFTKGIRVFCVTIDDEDNNYLPYIFGSANYIKIKRATELPEKLPKLYSLLTK
ncbi:MAG: VWA domain-containing protein [Kangiellaceae bacterium]|nr:VWA domain-containing protein [Kangiellaceae bacterium]